MRELESFFQENCYLPPNEKIMVSDRFGDGELLWEIRAVREAELRKMERETEENLCAAAVVFPGLQDRKLWESYGAKSGAEVLQKMLTPAEYLRLQKAVMALNGFQKRKAERRETAKN